MRGPFWTPITPLTGSFLHAGPQFGDKSVTVRRVIEATGREANSALLEAVEDLPIFGRESINNGKLGWFIRKNVNRIASGLKFQKGDCTERNSWQVCVVDQAST